ncbi:MAG TPA: MMPL family transporter [Gemmataceae bacterium]|jgi:RND superfamily putative drug exporter
MFKYLGRVTATHPWLICLAWLIVAGVVGLVAPKWDERAADDDIRFLPARCDSVKGHQLLEQAFPQDVFASRLILAIERNEAPLTRSDFAFVDGIADDLLRLRQDDPSLQIARICTYRDPMLGKRLVSGDGRCTLVQVSLSTPYLAVQTRATVDAIDRLLDARPKASSQNTENTELCIHLTGPAGIGRDLIAASANSLESTTLATIVLVVAVLLLVHRAPVMALIPLGTIAVSVWVALKILALCTLIPGFCVVNISQVFAVVMLYGAGTDYCLFLISRYREELARGRDGPSALARSVSGVGGALAASAATVICGLGLMGLAEFAKVRCGGPAIAISLSVALLASLTLTPALLRIMGPIAFWPRKNSTPTMRIKRMDMDSICENQPRLRHPRAISSNRPAHTEGLWGRISCLVVARPMLIGTAAVLALLPFALIGFGVQPNYRATSELSPNSDSILGLATIQRHFTAGEVGPITVLLESSTDWEGSRGRAILAHLSNGFGYLDNVAEVRSLTQPLGNPVSPLSALSLPLGGDDGKERKAENEWRITTMWRSAMKGMTDQINRAVSDFYVARLPRTRAEGPPRFVTRLDVVPHSDPFDAESIQTLELIQLWLREELPKYPGAEQVRAECHGVTVNARDLAQVTESDRLRINTLVLAGIFLILLALVRRPVFALYLLATVLFSYYASLGATTLLAHWWSGRPLGQVDWRVPFFLFTILVAVGEDYNILLVSRALEERRRHGAIEGIRRSLARTGGTITSCGIIMAGTFATLMLGGLSTLVQIGFALAFGVLMDTFVVRPILVPAFALWLWRSDEAEEQKPVVRRFPPRRNLAA